MRLVDALVILLAKENLLLQLGQRLAFTHFLMLLELRWLAIYRNIVTRSVEKQARNIVDSIHGSVMDVWNQLDVAATTNMWSSNAGDQYYTMSIHWIAYDWNLVTMILGT